MTECIWYKSTKVQNNLKAKTTIKYCAHEFPPTPKCWFNNTHLFLFHLDQVKSIILAFVKREYFVCAAFEKRKALGFI